jgi:hypothetical protein
MMLGDGRSLLNENSHEYGGQWAPLYSFDTAGELSEDISRPGRDAGPKFSTETTRVRRPFMARGSVVTFPESSWLSQWLGNDEREPDVEVLVP